MNFLLDIDVAVDNCAGRRPRCEETDLAIIKCQSECGRLWLSAISCQILKYVTRIELQRMEIAQGRKLSGKQLEKQARSLLREFAADKHLLADLADGGNVFHNNDLEDGQIIKALARLAPGSIKLLSNDGQFCQCFPTITTTPQQYLATFDTVQIYRLHRTKTQQDHSVLRSNKTSTGSFSAANR